MASIIKPGIQPKNITNSPRAKVGGVASPARKLSPLVENISAKNPFSNIQRRNPELRNVRGARTLTNMMSTFGTAKNEKIIRNNLQLLRNSLVESFEMAKLLRTTAGLTDKQLKQAGGAIAIAIAGIVGVLNKSKEVDDKDDKEDKQNELEKSSNNILKEVKEFVEEGAGPGSGGRSGAKKESDATAEQIEENREELFNIFKNLHKSFVDSLDIESDDSGILGLQSLRKEHEEYVDGAIEAQKQFVDMSKVFENIKNSIDGFVTKIQDFFSAKGNDGRSGAKNEKDNKEKKKLGGLINGPSHDQGGVDINAEGGEVVMSNAAGEVWGRDNLLQMNAEAVTGKKKKKKNPLLNLTEEDYKWLAYALSGEAERGTDDEFGVAASILNRVASPNFKGNVKDVVNNPGQYEAVTEGTAFHDKELAAFLQSEEGQKGIVAALERLQGRTDFKGQSQIGNRVPEEDPMFSDKGNFFHYFWQSGDGRTKPEDWVMPNYQQFLNQSKVDGVKNKNVSSIESQLNKGGFVNVALGNGNVKVISSPSKKGSRVINSTPASSNGPTIAFLNPVNPDCSNLVYKSICSIDG